MEATVIKSKVRSLPDKLKSFFARSNARFVVNRSLLVSFFAFPIALLYVLRPESFEYVWTGRTIYVLFLWLLLIEIVLAWGKPLKEALSPLNARVLAAFTTLLFPTVYVSLTVMFGFRSQIIELGRFLGVPGQYGPHLLETAWPFALEFYVFAVSFLLSVWLLYGLNAFKRFSISGFFLTAFSTFYSLDVFFPYGSIQVLQSIVPVTVAVSVWVLGLMGYGTYTTSVSGGSLLMVTRGGGRPAAFLVYWPSGGVQSLILYSFTILFFLRNATMPFWRKGVYFIVGAVGTFFANVFRIASISVLGVSSGTEAAKMFHDYYGELYFIVWMILYLLIVFLIESYLHRRRRKSAPSEAQLQ